jgi:hypothetical protein
MRFPAAVLPIAISCMLIGCTGEIRTKLLSPQQLDTELRKPEGIRGVFGYYTRSVIEVDNLTQLTDVNGKPVPGPCRQILTQKITTIKDQDHPYEIWYQHGLLEANQFSVQLSDGVFTAINSQSTPDQGKTLSNLASAATSLLGAAAKGLAPPGPPVPQPDCNAGPSFVQFKPLPPLP